jgi:hypothetical protein
MILDKIVWSSCDSKGKDELTYKIIQCLHCSGNENYKLEQQTVRDAYHCKPNLKYYCICMIPIATIIYQAIYLLV